MSPRRVHKRRIDGADLASLLRSSSVYDSAMAFRTAYIDNCLDRFLHILTSLDKSGCGFKGPTVDAGSGLGVLYPAIKKYFPAMLPVTTIEYYPVTELSIDGDRIPSHRVDCERERLPFPDGSQRTVLFFDCLEHLIADPMHAFLEFNRILAAGGHLAINTPNAAYFYRMALVLQGVNPASENAYKPNAAERHNREWTIGEVRRVAPLAGFDMVYWTTGNPVVVPLHYEAARQAFSWESAAPIEELGPNVFAVLRKARTIERESLPPAERYPTGIYQDFVDPTAPAPNS